MKYVIYTIYFLILILLVLLFTALQFQRFLLLQRLLIVYYMCVS